jgi:hypothetical protein
MLVSAVKDANANYLNLLALLLTFTDNPVEDYYLIEDGRKIIL